MLPNMVPPWQGKDSSSLGKLSMIHLGCALHRIWTIFELKRFPPDKMCADTPNKERFNIPSWDNFPLEDYLPMCKFYLLMYRGCTHGLNVHKFIQGKHILETLQCLACKICLCFSSRIVEVQGDPAWTMEEQSSKDGTLELSSKDGILEQSSKDGIRDQSSKDGNLDQLDQSSKDGILDQSSKDGTHERLREIGPQEDHGPLLLYDGHVGISQFTKKFSRRDQWQAQKEDEASVYSCLVLLLFFNIAPRTRASWFRSEVGEVELFSNFPPGSVARTPPLFVKNFLSYSQKLNQTRFGRTGTLVLYFQVILSGLRLHFTIVRTPANNPFILSAS
jgi:hypothetical protein